MFYPVLGPVPPSRPSPLPSSPQLHPAPPPRLCHHRVRQPSQCSSSSLALVVVFPAVTLTPRRAHVSGAQAADRIVSRLLSCRWLCRRACDATLRGTHPVNHSDHPLPFLPFAPPSRNGSRLNRCSSPRGGPYAPASRRFLPTAPRSRSHPPVVHPRRRASCRRCRAGWGWARRRWARISRSC